MNKKVLALSVASVFAGFAFNASAGVVPGTGPMTATNATVLEFNGDGIGHALLVPYYTVQEGNATLLNLVNTDVVNAKAVKVRFRGAQNSDDVFDFHVYLSPGDIWAAAVTEGPDGRAMLSTPDNSCTLPASVDQSFVIDRLPGATAADKAAGTREGYVEIFNMADIPPAGANSLYAAIKHAADGTVACGAPLTGLVNNITLEADAVAAGFNTPTTGLTANWTVINVPEAAAWSGQAEAIEARVAAGGAAANGNFVWHPQTATAVGAFVGLSADPLLVGGSIAGAMYDLPDMSTPYFGADANAQAVALTAALAVNTVTNEYITDPGVFAATDWVFSMPTRRYAVAVDYDPDVLVFNAALNGYFSGGNVSLNGFLACTELGSIEIYDRSERTLEGGDFVISPGTPTTLELCGETSVLSFNNAGVSVLGAALSRSNVATSSFADGWARIATPGNGAGLPVLGSAFVKATNPAAMPGVAGNYGASYAHRVTRP